MKFIFLYTGLVIVALLIVSRSYEVSSLNSAEYSVADAGLMIHRFDASDQPENVSNTEHSLKQRFIEAMAPAEEVVFATRAMQNWESHWYANVGTFCYDTSHHLWYDQGRLCKWNILTDEIEIILSDTAGCIRDPQVHYDGDRILFSWRKGGSEFFNIYEIGIDGKGLRQVTSGPYDDLECIYLPDGDIVFVSTRCMCWVNCYVNPSYVLYRCGPNGENIRRISDNYEIDNTPWLLPDGRIIYMRWEYIDVGFPYLHHLWVMNPDGTGQMTFFGNLDPNIRWNCRMDPVPDPEDMGKWGLPLMSYMQGSYKVREDRGFTVIIDAKPIPDTDGEVLAIFSPNHGLVEHMGRCAIIDTKHGPDDAKHAREFGQHILRDPYPLSRDVFMAARGQQILAMDRQGNYEVLFELPPEIGQCLYGGKNIFPEKGIKRFPPHLGQYEVDVHEPRPLRPRQREHIIPERTDYSKNTGTVFLADVYHGRKMRDVKRGSIKKILVMQPMQRPICPDGITMPISHNSTYVITKLLGTVDVNHDGSAYFEAPADAPMFFIALDENNEAVKRMFSFCSVKPGEFVGCVGCHEKRTETFLPRNTNLLNQTLQKIKPLPGIPQKYDYPRDIQPILDRHCLDCHNTEKYAGGMDLSGDQGVVFSMSYMNLVLRDQMTNGQNLYHADTDPYSFRAGTSPLLEKLSGGHHEVEATEHELETVRFWIEAGIPYAGTYAALGAGYILRNTRDGVRNKTTGRHPVPSDADWSTYGAFRGTMENKCSECHKIPLQLVRGPWTYPMHPYRIFNLSRPELSLCLSAPLSKEDGGLGICLEKSGEKHKILRGKDDPAYRNLMAHLEAGKDYLEENKRFDMEGFVPSELYMYWMKRYGVLPADARAEDIDPYEVDEMYFRKLGLTGD
jgi:hypothetical protein